MGEKEDGSQTHSLRAGKTKNGHESMRERRQGMNVYCSGCCTLASDKGSCVRLTMVVCVCMRV